MSNRVYVADWTSGKVRTTYLHILDIVVRRQNFKKKNLVKNFKTSVCKSEILEKSVRPHSLNFGYFSHHLERESCYHEGRTPQETTRRSGVNDCLKIELVVVELVVGGKGKSEVENLPVLFVA